MHILFQELKQILLFFYNLKGKEIKLIILVNLLQKISGLNKFINSN
jgi:hypothetical protein